jgi:hypothetical protein
VTRLAGPSRIADSELAPTPAPVLAASRRRVGVLAAAAGVLVLAAVPRAAALSAEFWLDEIWSWEFARAAASPWQVVAGDGFHHDNNHKLNTLFLHLMPGRLPWAWYRLHALAAGLAAVALAWRVASDRGRAEAVFASVLVATNYWLVLGSAEARGYALAVCAALAAFGCLRRYLARGGWGAAAGFWVAVVLGFLSHLTFLHCYLALGLWSVRQFARRRRAPGDELWEILRVHAVPAAFVALLFVFDVRRMELGGGPPQPVSGVLLSLVGRGLGAAGEGWTAWLAAAFAAVTFAAGLWLLRRDPHGTGLFFAAVVGVPALLLAARRPPFLFERYLLLPFVFYLLLLAYVLGDFYRRSRAGRFLVPAVVLLIAAGGLAEVRDFVRGGRGRFQEVLAYVGEQTPGPSVALTGDHDFRVAKFVRFYAPYDGGGKEFVYETADALPAGGARWLLVHRTDDRHPPGPEVQDRHGNTYRLERDFRTGTFGGWDWFVYRNAAEK